MEKKLRPGIIAWEITRSCNLACRHCRAAAVDKPYAGELSTSECMSLIDNIAELGSSIVILTGGEPLLRSDIFDLALYGVSMGLRMVMAPNGTLLTSWVAEKIKEVGISRISVSIDFPKAYLHNDFRGSPGAFESAISGIKNALKTGIEVQINSTITKLNVDYLSGLLKLAEELGAVAFHPFLLVPTGRGKKLKKHELTPEEYEKTLNWIYDRQQEKPGIFFKPTDVPHYFRVLAQRSKGKTTMKGNRYARGIETLTRGCLAGTGFCFISHTGDVQPCGYFNCIAGNVKEKNFVEIWNESKLFADLRDFSKLKGKCGVCEYKDICGGCRARAYEATGDYMAEEPYCIYIPHNFKSCIKK